MYRIMILLLVLVILMPVNAQGPVKVPVATFTCNGTCVFYGGFAISDYDYLTATSDENFLLLPGNRSFGNLIVMASMFGYADLERSITELYEFTVFAPDTVTIDIWKYALDEPENTGPVCCDYIPEQLPWQPIALERLKRLD